MTCDMSFLNEQHLNVGHCHSFTRSYIDLAWLKIEREKTTATKEISLLEHVTKHTSATMHLTQKELRERSITNDIDECVCIYLNGWVVFSPLCLRVRLLYPSNHQKIFFSISLSNRAVRHIFILCCSTEICLFFVVLIWETHFHSWRDDVTADWSDKAWFE